MAESRSVFPGFQYDSESGARAAAIRVDTASLVDVHQAELLTYFNGGCRSVRYLLDPGARPHVH